MEAIDEDFVVQAARIAGLDLPAADVPAVLEHLRRDAAFARLVNEIALPVEDEIAPTWQP